MTSILEEDNIHYPNICKLSNDNILFYDIFMNDYQIILISPEDIVPNKIQIFVGEQEHETICSSFQYINTSPILIMKFKLKFLNDEFTKDFFKNIFQEHNNIKITIEYNDTRFIEEDISKNISYKNTFVLTSLNDIKTDKKKLILTTLFKDDYYLLDIFFHYYELQGVEHFYMYYNGKLETLKQYYDIPIDKANITWIEWDFKYQQEHAQSAQLNHALLKYGKTHAEYILCNDLDEYLSFRYVDNNTTFRLIDIIDIELLQQNDTKLDTIGFCNCWSVNTTNIIPMDFPLFFYASSVANAYGNRSKCIHRIDTIDKIINFHAKELNANIEEKKAANDMFIMFHFFNWSNPDRIMEIVNKKKYFIDQSANIILIGP